MALSGSSGLSLASKRKNYLSEKRKVIGQSTPTYIAIAELPAVVDEKPEIMPLLGKLLRQGRQYDLCFIGATQDMLVKTLGTSSGVRECFRTGFYTGGDQTTARIILDLSKGQSIN